jgi:hypothetical protein
MELLGGVGMPEPGVLDGGTVMRVGRGRRAGRGTGSYGRNGPNGKMGQ